MVLHIRRQEPFIVTLFYHRKILCLNLSRFLLFFSIFFSLYTSNTFASEETTRNAVQNAFIANYGRPADPEGLTSTDRNWYQPEINTTWQWQLSGDINIAYQVDMYDIDLFDTRIETIASLQNAGIRVICYFSAGSWEGWRGDATRFDKQDIGKTLDGWPDERWLNITSGSVREIMLARLDLARQKGCDGVEPDNVTAYKGNSGFALTAQEQLDYNRFLAKSAHKRGLAIGLKNDLGQVIDLVDHFDFAVNEQCHQYNECDLLQPFIDAGKPVFNAEYADRYLADSRVLCSDTLNRQFRTLILPVNLDDSFRISCEDRNFE
ncbi:MAG: endo alpha-1,4 polygalactosaminidase [Gammaproteobacteria bacterium]|nr:MAG: endo alpha-1,4 polygalactosaminidase [Gammaproteobacteria bacterium]